MTTDPSHPPVPPSDPPSADPVAGEPTVARQVAHAAGAPADEGRQLAAFFHDVRAPLSAIQLVVDALEDGVIDESLLPDHLRRLQLLVERLAALTRDLAPDAAPRERVAVCVQGLLLDAAAIAGPAAQLADVGLHVTMADESLEVLADPATLARALDNIVDNAIRHTPRGSLVTLSAWEEGQDEQRIVCLVVVDGCVGIPTAEVDLLFDAGYQGDQPGCAGLGLAIAREIVEDQDGRIDVDNHDVGCRFEIRLPGPT